MRHVLDIAYKGTNYAGWQIQPNAVTVQEVLDNALSTLLRESIRSTGAGRTDSGVHAKQLIVHFDHETPLPPNFFHGVNGILPYDIAVHSVSTPTNPQFHARFDAFARSYEYHVVTQKTPFAHESALWLRRQVDFDKMNEAAAVLSDYTDFASFCKANHQSRTTLCDLTSAYWESSPSGWIFHIQANRFLRGMVRATVGTLLEVGKGKIDLTRFKEIIEARDRKKAGANAPAHGLYLTEVSYPENSFSPWP